MRALTVGTFDLGHYGHADLFSWCRSVANEVVVGVNTDDFIKRYKGKPPVLSYDERVGIIQAFRDVDEVLPNEAGEDSKPLILRVAPDIIVIGSDWMKKDYMKQMNLTPEWLEEQRIALMYIPRHIKISTSDIKARL